MALYEGGLLCELAGVFPFISGVIFTRDQANASLCSYYNMGWIVVWAISFRPHKMTSYSLYTRWAMSFSRKEELTHRDDKSAATLESTAFLPRMHHAKIK